VNRFLRIFPEAASTMAERVDALFYFLCTISIFVTLLISVLILYYAVRYRRRPGEDATPYRSVHLDPADARRLELAWIAAPLAVFLLIFWWAAKLYAAMHVAPADAMPVYVVGKQWMWKVQHLGGRREINELHVPVGKAVRLTMTSEDVIHSFFVPAFRVKADVLPGRYTTMWFEATQVGEFHLFCAEYCGTKHSEMIGKIVVMEPRDFQTWLGGGAEGSLTQAGEKLFGELGCITCHNDKADARGPQLAGLFGKTVELQNGDTVVADEAYLREAILEPQKRVVAGYQPLMPTYVTQLSEEKVIELIAYIRSLQAAGPPSPSASIPMREPPPLVPSAGGGGAGAAGDGGDGATGTGGSGGDGAKGGDGGKSGAGGAPGGPP
jgi:cytochrome c oxidase subunit 2